MFVDGRFIVNTTESENTEVILKKYIEETNPRLKKKYADCVIKKTIPLVKAIAKKLARRSTDPIEDIIQVGTVGLLKAVEFYDSAHNTSFKTFASYFITGEIKHYLRDKSAMIKPPREIYELTVRMAKLVEELRVNGEIDTSDYEIAEKLKVPISKIREAEEVERRRHILSLDSILSFVDSDGSSLMDRIPDDGYFVKPVRFENRLIINEALGKLDEESANLIKMNFFDDISQAEIAKIKGLSQMQVSRRIKRALGKLMELTEEKDISK